MSRRVLLVGRGPRPGPDARHVSFSQLRTAHFARALRGAGHAVRCVWLGDTSSGPRPATWDADVDMDASGPDVVRRTRDLDGGQAEVVVSAGPYLPGRIAAALKGSRPFWADVPGDPFAELQAADLCAGGTLSAARRADALSAARFTMGAADRLSVIGPSQRLATIGALGALGRLVGEASHHERVHVVPIAAWMPTPVLQPRPRAPGAPLTLALSGAFNHWLDVPALIDGLDAAFAGSKALRLICTGGAADGLDARSYAQFSRWASHYPGRVTQHGWLPHADVPRALNAAHVGVWLDRPGYEAQLGCRTRAILFSWCGLALAASPTTDIARDLADRGHLTPLPRDDAQAFAAALIELQRRGDSATQARAAHAHLVHTRAPAACAQPLLSWVESPTRGPARAADPVGDEVQRLRAALGKIHNSPTWRFLAPIHGSLRRILGR